MTREQKFYKTLQDVFIGAEIEGEGGFINLMRIKSNYYRKIESILKDDIEDALKKYSSSFRDELFDKLYSFFSRYFTESGSIYFNSTPFHNNIYEKVYTDEKDVILFWKTQMLYYVKTDRIFRSMPVSFDELKFYFDASGTETKKANEKRSVVFELNKINDDGTIVFNVRYSEKGTKTKSDEILKTIKKRGIDFTEEKLTKAFRTFEKQSEVDFFINRNAKAFLQEQFKLWSYQYFWDGAAEWSAERVNQLQTLKDIAFKIIDFVAQFEDELVKIWNKPKFVKNSNYVITLDRLPGPEFVKKILSHKNIKEQVNEWKELGMIDDSFKPAHVLEKELHGEKLSAKYEHLPVDTKYFKDLETEIIAQYDHLDRSLDGRLIKSENYQALNTILPKFREKVQTIYIDPPFNLDSSDQFLYRTNYKDSNWATLLDNRLRIAKNWLNRKGNVFVRCDYNGNWIVRYIMDIIFSKDNLRNELIVNRISKKGFANRESFQPIKYPEGNDYLFFYAISDNSYFHFVKVLGTSEKKEKWHSMDVMDINPQERPRIILGKEMIAPSGRKWMFSQEKIYEMENEGLIKLNSKGIPQYKVKNQENELLDSK